MLIIVNKNEIVASSNLPKDKLKDLCDVEWLEEQYLEKRMTDQEVGKLLGVCRKTARKYRSLFNIKRDPYKSIDDNWYAIDPYLCYLIGFIFADGHLHKGGLRVCLHKRDIILLREFKKRYGGVIYQSKSLRKANTALWCLIRRKLTNYLVNNWGMTPGPKSHNMPPVPTLNGQLMPHFARGYFDGDGSVWKDKRGYLGLNIACVDGQFLTAFRDSLPVQHRFKIYKYPDGVFILCTSGKKAKSFLGWMWADGQGFHLWRKWKDYKDKEMYQCLMS